MRAGPLLVVSASPMVPSSGLEAPGTQEPWVELVDTWTPSPLCEDPIRPASPGPSPTSLSLPKAPRAIPLSEPPGPCTHLLPSILSMLPPRKDSGLNSSTCHSSPARLSSLYSLPFSPALSHITGVTHHRPLPRRLTVGWTGEAGPLELTSHLLWWPLTVPVLSSAQQLCECV